MDLLLVNLVGAALIAWIVWYFWLSRRVETVAMGESSRQGLPVDVHITVKGGYRPDTIVLRPGERARLHFTRREASTCGEELLIPSLGKHLYLPENQTVTLEVTPDKPGEHEFTCGMSMYRGRLIVR